MLDPRRALQLAPDDRNHLNTAAAVAAERNELVEAKDLLDKTTGTADPELEDWYVHGRILEQIGLRDDAIAAYRRAAKKQSDDFMVTTAGLAQRRLSALGAKP